jgi:hypothetical protein
MPRKTLRDSVHLSDEDLLLWADGEHSPARAADVRRHLETCWKCRARSAELERAIADFVDLYQLGPEASLPPAEGPRALLKARLAERAAGSTPARRIIPLRAAAVFAAVLLFAAAAVRLAHHANTGSEMGAIPNVNLTPGATYPISIHDACSGNLSTNDPAVPDPLKREVLKEYGLNNLPATNYEIDYLVNPQLGGAASIRNLWPQPSLNTVWNARVKDALEDRLHAMVCSGQLDLPTAQREISQDWVAAYKKYFRTKTPLEEHS